ncbi:MAG TPA: DUF4276 family protein [Polyangia bacterium]|jgi:hypothetical protein|nr:DUF4276 family protein [Polyangia bacterium]
MTTLRVIVEGRTEARFITQILAPHLGTRNVFACASPVITKGKRSGVREGQGGGRSYLAWRQDITAWIKQEGHRRDFWFTTMFDLYGLERVRNFPGYAEARKLTDPEAKVASLEAALGQDIGFERFIPYLQLHEFESLLLVDPTALKNMFIEQARAVDDLAREISDTARPAEHINEGEETRPSGRISKHLPAYASNKVVAGTDAAADIGLDRLVAACPHFGAWVQRLEELGGV